MKTIRFQLLLLALFVMVGCQKDEMSTSMKKGSYSLVASIENNDSTSRTAVDENGGVTWVATDAIGVFGSQTQNAKFESISSGSNVLFIGNMDSSNEEPTLAYYPYDENASLDGNVLSFILPSEYSYTGQSYAPMLGIKQANGDFVFKHLVGLLKVTIEDIPQNATKFVITSKGNEPLPISGIAKVEDVTIDNAVLELQSLPNSYSVTYNFSPTVFSSDKIFYIPLPVGTYERLVVSLIGNEDDVIFERSISNLKVERRAMIEMPVVGCEEGISYTLADDVFPIYKSDENYITSVESNKITYKSNIPADRRPQVGQILLFSDVTEMFPSGCLRRIINIINTVDSFIVETEHASLDEAFKDLKLKKKFDLIELLDSEINTRAVESTTDQKEWILPINGAFSYSDWSLSFEGQIVFKTRVDLDIHIENGEMKGFTIIYTPKPGINIDDLSLQFEKESKMIIGKEAELLSPYIPLGPVVLRAGLFWGLYANFSGKAEMAIPMKIEYDTSVRLNLIENEFNLEFPSFNVNLDYDDIFTDKFDVKFKGLVGIGPGVGLILRFYELADVKVKFTGYMALKGEAEVFLKSVYKVLKEGKIQYGPLVELGASIGAGITKKIKLELDLGNITFDKLMDEGYFLPTISNMKLYTDVSDVENEDVVIAYDVQNWAWFSHKHQIQVYQDEELIQTLDYTGYSDYLRDTQGTIDYNISGLKYGEKYKAKALIQTKALGGQIYEADSLEFVVPENIQVTTGEATDISYHAASFDATIKGMNFNSDFEYGIFCSLENEPTAENSVKVEVGKVKDGKFAASTNQLKEGERYSYRAYVYKNGEYHYGEIKDFATMAMNVKSLSYSNLTNNSVTLAGIIEGLNNLDQYEYGICYSTGISPSKDYGTLVKGVNIQNGSFSVNVIGLTENTTYYWCAYAIKDGKYYYGSIKSFKTNEVSEPASERDILIAFYKATDGDNWKNNENWCSDKPLREWFGITTDGDGYVTSIYLSGELVIETKESRKFGLKGNANLSNLSKLEDLYLEHNELTSLTVENCPNLYRLLCSYNALTEVNVDGVGYLSLDNNQLTSLDFSDSNKFAKLIYLQADNNQLSTINLSAYSNLSELSVSENQLISLDVSNCETLNRLTCDRNQLTNLNVTGCNELVFLQCFDNQLTTINLKGLVNLTRVDCRINKLKSLDLSGLNKITYLELRENELTELDVSDLIKLKGINCNNNKLTKLKMHEGIVSLDCSYNSFTELDLSDYANLEQFVSMGNSIQKLNFEGCSKLARMQLENKIPVESLNLTGCTSFGSKGLLLFNTLFKDIYLPASLSNYQSNFKVWGDWIESEGRYQYPKFHWQ